MKKGRKEAREGRKGKEEWREGTKEGKGKYSLILCCAVLAGNSCSIL